MSDSESFEARLRAVERALTDGDHDFAEIADAADHHARLADLDDRLTAVEDRLADLEAATQALRGYVGNVRAVNREVERRADAAIAAVESIEEGDAVESTGVEPATVYPPPRRPDDADDEDDPGLLDRFREVL